MSDSRTAYHQAFLQKAGPITNREQPKSPALVLFFGDVALSMSDLALRTLSQHLPPAYRDAVIAGCFGNAKNAAGISLYGEADSLPCCEVQSLDDGRPFGQFASQWLSQNREQAAQFIRTLLLRVTEKMVAKTMSVVDVHLVVGNDGGACELWPSIAELLWEIAGAGMVVRLNLIWLYRELSPMRRDAAMYRLLTSLAKALSGGEAEREALFTCEEGHALLHRTFPLGQVQTLCVLSDRNGNNICSPKVWQHSGASLAAFVLCTLYGSLPPASTVNCSSIDMLYPDEQWSAGFQLSALQRLRQHLEQNESQALSLYRPLLMQQSAWGDGGGADPLTAAGFEALVARALPVIPDLYALPLNGDLPAGALRRMGTYAECTACLYGNRFENFFADVLSGETLETLTDLLWASMVQSIRAFALTHGPAAAYALTTEVSGRESLATLLTSLQAYLASREPAAPRNATLSRSLMPSLGARRAELLEQHGKERLQMMRRDAALRVLSALTDRLRAAAEPWRREREAFALALSSAETALSDAFYDVKTHTFYAQLLTYARYGALYADGQTGLSAAEVSLLGGEYAQNHSVVNTQRVLDALTALNLAKNRFIGYTLSSAFAALAYAEGFRDLTNALRERCVPTVFSTLTPAADDVWIAPSDGNLSVQAKLNAGERIVELIRIYRSPNHTVDFWDAIAYLKRFAAAGVQPPPDTVLPGDAREAKADPPVLPDAGAPAAPMVTQEAAMLLTTRYAMGRTLINIPWPAGANTITLRWEGGHLYGDPPQISEMVIIRSQYLTDGGVSVPCRLLGPYTVTTVWSLENIRHERTDRMLGDRDYVSYHVEKGDSLEGKPTRKIELTSRARPLDFAKYFLLAKHGVDGRTVHYRLPPSTGMQLVLNHLQADDSDRLEIEYREPQWRDYFTVEPR